MADRDEKKQIALTGRARWKAATSADTQQIEREVSDLRFLVDHWPADIRTARAGGNQGSVPSMGGMAVPPTPARPCIQIDNISEPIARVLNSERSSDINVQIVPADDFGDLGITLDETEITLREGLIRRIQRESQAQDARSWAFKRAVQAGRGYYLVNVRFLPGTFNREVYVHRIYDQTGVRLDPAHEQPDGSDANWGQIGGWVPWDVYKARWPSEKTRRNRLSDATVGEFEDMAVNEPTWVSATNANKPEGKGDDATRGDAVFVVQYWYATLRARSLVLLQDGQEAWRDELPEDFDATQIVDERDDVVREISFCILDGLNDYPLEESEWESPDVPIIKVLGEELQPFNGERRVQGMVRPARDAQFGFDAMVSKQVEQIALAPIPALHVDPDAIEEYQGWYAVANTRTLPYLPSRTYDDQGRQLAPPTRLNADPNILPVAQSIALFKQGIESTTSTSDPALGRTDPTVKSARHAQALIRETEFGTGHYLDNLIRSMRYEGQIENSLLYSVYGKRPGRLARILTGEGESEVMAINPPDSPQNAQNRQIAQKVGVLTEHAKCNVIVKVTKSADSRRDQETTVIGELISAQPEFITWFGDLFFRNQDGPGHQQMAERAKVMLAPPIQKFLAEKEQGQEPLPPQVQAEMQQLQERLQMADQALQLAQKEREGKLLENQAKMEIEAAKTESDERIKKLEADRDIMLAQMDNATKIRVAEIAAEAKGVQSGHEHEAQALGLAAEHAENELDRAHQRDVAQQAAAVAGAQQGQQQAHEVGMAGASADQDSAEAEAGRQHETALTEAQMAAQQAAETTE